MAGKLEAGRQIVSQMESANLDPKRPRLVTQLFLGDDKRLVALKQRLDQVGWPAAADGPGRLLASATTPTDRNWVAMNTAAMCAAADAFDVEWDGWDVDVAADHVQQKPQ
ncbi:hypothetical protein IP88_05125 [alpha proteobacterium AAP81b]|nr:hypothetical protein IP88_05125 [alpha proteobacterium AAP81b]